MNRIKQLAGNRFGKLIAIEPTERREDNKVIWKCICDCGNICYIRSTYLVQGWSKSCGCSKYPKLKVNGKSKKEYGISASNQLYSNYKRQAKNRNIIFNIPQQEFLLLTQQPCYYCGIYPQQEQKSKGGNGTYIYNGIDRLDNSKGYFTENCVPCCGNCNRAKSNKTIEEFKSWILNLYNTFILEKPKE